VIRQYYGTLIPSEDQIRNPRISVPALAKSMRMVCTTIYNIVRRFVYRGFVIEDRRANNGAKPAPFSAECLTYITSKQNLMAQAHMSLQRSAFLLNLVFETDMWNKQRLQRVYQKNGIKFVKPQLSYAREFLLNQDELHRKR